ncbi:Hypothetical protein NTJ_09614 [Nesidiocoris tenuis]|uniref:Uncharacterized protein n=1 Tax=Nesidiocoris tenuis TaxID=355587 RepID=A0ABN7AXW0_9HEMI|nr:Hypothetical protein NTJ_09614 [Nesidiocoris tenuis]
MLTLFLYRDKEPAMATQPMTSPRGPTKSRSSGTVRPPSAPVDVWDPHGNRVPFQFTFVSSRFPVACESVFSSRA